LKLIDSYGWIEYFSDGPLAKKYADYIEDMNENNTVTPTVVVYEVYERLKKEKGEQTALEAYAQITRTKLVPLDDALALTAADTSLKMDLAMADAIVFTIAKTFSADLVTSDPDFKGLDGVRLIE
jgi:predicted nucleic acid-binding protein